MTQKNQDVWFTWIIIYLRPLSNFRSEGWSRIIFMIWNSTGLWGKWGFSWIRHLILLNPHLPQNPVEFQIMRKITDLLMVWNSTGVWGKPRGQVKAWFLRLSQPGLRFWSDLGDQGYSWRSGFLTRGSFFPREIPGKWLCFWCLLKRRASDRDFTWSPAKFSRKNQKFSKILKILVFARKLRRGSGKSWLDQAWSALRIFRLKILQEDFVPA